MHDVVIVGAGPAGRSLARALAQADSTLDVVCVDPTPAAPWRTTWGMWADDAERCGVAPAVADRMNAPRLRFGTHDTRVARAYVVIDPERLRAMLSVGVRIDVGAAASVGPARVTLTDGRELVARVVVDARGSKADAVVGAAAQTALGVVLDGSGLAPTWMDFSMRHIDDDARPTFGYVVPLGDGKVLVEETALAASPPMERATLARRLELRLAALGVAHAPRVAVEWVAIPLDVTAAPGRAPIAFGVCGGSVHPATGYALATVLADAPAAAAAIATALAQGRDADATARAVERALWPTWRRATRRLHVWGRDALMRLDLDEQRAFFAGFFALAAHRQRAMLSTRARPIEVAAAMLALALSADLPLSLRAKLLPRRARVSAAIPTTAPAA